MAEHKHEWAYHHAGYVEPHKSKPYLLIEWRCSDVTCLVISSTVVRNIPMPKASK